MIDKKRKPTADQQRRTAARDDAVSILHALIGYLHVDDAERVDRPLVTAPASSTNRPLLTVKLSADVPRHVFESIAHWDADADPDLDDNMDNEREVCTDTEGVHC